MIKSGKGSVIAQTHEVNDVNLCILLAEDLLCCILGPCQGDGDDTLPGEEGVAEYDSYLEEAAGAILPPGGFRSLLYGA